MAKKKGNKQPAAPVKVVPGSHVRANLTLSNGELSLKDGSDVKEYLKQLNAKRGEGLEVLIIPVREFNAFADRVFMDSHCPPTA